MLNTIIPSIGVALLANAPERPIERRRKKEKQEEVP